MNFTCPYCNRDTTITEPNFSQKAEAISTSASTNGFIGLRHEAIACPNQDCKALSLSVKLVGYSNSSERYHDQNGVIVQKWNLLPSSHAKIQPDYIPKAIRDDYFEACAILELSPKASATLSRRCLQGIVRNYWNIPNSKRGNLGAELSYVKDEIEPDTWAGIEAIRSVGDIGAHMEKDVNFVVDVAPEEANLLVSLIEMLFEDWYMVREKRRERTAKAKALSATKLTEKKVAKIEAKKTIVQEVEK